MCGNKQFAKNVNDSQPRGGAADALGVGAKELHVLDHVGGVGLLLALLLHEPIEQLHGTEVVNVVGGLVALVDRGRDVALVLEASLQRRKVVGEGLVGLGDGCHLDLVVVVQ